MQACCPKCDTLCPVYPGKILDGRRRQYTTVPHRRPVHVVCGSRVTFHSRDVNDPGFWICALCGVIPTDAVDENGPRCNGGTIS